MFGYEFSKRARFESLTWKMKAKVINDLAVNWRTNTYFVDRRARVRRKNWRFQVQPFVLGDIL